MSCYICESKHVYSRLQINVGVSFNRKPLYDIKTGYSVLRKEHNVKVFENRVLREYLPRVRGKICCRTLKCWISVIRVARHVARKERMKNEYWLSHEETKGKILFRNHLCKW